MRPPVIIEPVTPQNVIELAIANGNDSGHCAPLATNLWRREGRIVGACGVFAPTLTFWADTHLNARDSLTLVEEAKALADNRKVKYLVCCSKESPFHPLMPKFGFRWLGAADYYDVAT